MNRKNYLLTALLVILTFNYLDRLALGVVLQNIKQDLHLTDTQLGLLGGIAFALFYAVMGIPIARWADRGNRVTIITLTTALWSVAVALCGAVGNFVQLLVVRVGVAVGEAGCQPTALSLISDAFTRAERPRAVSRYMLGWPLALMIGYLSAGWLNELYGWRATFAILGLPGLLLAAVARLTLKEPRKEALQISSEARLPIASAPQRLRLKDVLATLWRNEAYRHLLYSTSVVNFFTYGIMQWQPAFFVRTHGLTSGELGTWLAGVYGVTGLLGTWFGGEWVSRYAGNDERLQFNVIACLYIVFGALTVAVYLAPDHRIAFAVLAFACLGGAATNGPVFAATQTLVPPHMRATALALVLFCSNLIGLGLGPLAVGALSDALHPQLGEQSLRYALVAFCPGYIWAAWHLWWASRTAREVAAAQEI